MASKRRRRVRTALQKSGLVPKAKRPRSRFLKDGSVKESVIQADIMAWLKTTGLMFWRSNSGSLFLRGRHINLGPLGCADISMVVHPTGRFVGLEVKSKRGKIRKDQVAYAEGLTKQGGLYFIVRSVDDAKRAVAMCLGEQTWTLPSGPHWEF